MFTRKSRLAKVSTPNLQSFSKEMDRVLGYCATDGRITYNMFGAPEAPASAVGVHERLHRHLFLDGCMGSFQRLLLLLSGREDVTREHQLIYRRVLEKTYSATFFIQEGCAVYGSLLAAMNENPASLGSFIAELPPEYQQAYALVHAILPDPARMPGNYRAFVARAQCALYFGLLCTAQQVLVHYSDWDRLLDRRLRFIDYDTPDELLAFLSEQPPTLRQALEKFVDEFQDEGDWDRFIEMMAGKIKGPGCPLTATPVVTQGESLLRSWQKQLRGRGYKYIERVAAQRWYDEDVERLSATTRVARFAPSAILRPVREYKMPRELNELIVAIRESTLGDTPSSLEALLIERQPVLIRLCDGKPDETSFSLNGSPRAGITQNRSILLHIIFPKYSDLLPSEGKQLPSELFCHTAWLAPAEISQLNKAAARPGVSWFVAAEEYDLRKSMSTWNLMPGHPTGFTLHNVFVKEADLERLLINTGDGCYFVARPSEVAYMCLIAKGSELRYTFTDQHGLQIFAKVVRSRTLSQLHDSNQLGKYGTVHYVVNHLLFADHVFSSLDLL